MTTVGESVSRIRNTLKAVKEDPFVTDRQIYYNIVKFGKALIKRESDKNKLMRLSGLITTLPFMELIDVDKIEAGCTGIYSGCTFKRTEEKLPLPYEGTYGPLLRAVTSIDGTIKLYKTESKTYTSISRSSTFKYNKKAYFWYLNGYLYIPNVDWDAIRVEGIFEGDTGDFLCDPKAQCTIKQDQQFPFPEYLFAEIEQMVLNELTLTLKINDPGADDSQNPHR